MDQTVRPRTPKHARLSPWHHRLWLCGTDSKADAFDGNLPRAAYGLACVRRDLARGAMEMLLGMAVPGEHPGAALGTFEFSGRSAQTISLAD